MTMSWPVRLQKATDQDADWVGSGADPGQAERSSCELSWAWAVGVPDRQAMKTMAVKMATADPIDCALSINIRPLTAIAKIFLEKCPMNNRPQSWVSDLEQELP